MCTALTLMNEKEYALFGRNMDIPYNFGQAPVLVPRNFGYEDRLNKVSKQTKYAILGMGNVLENHPLLADGFNEKGLGVAGLNFPVVCEYATESVEGKNNIALYDLMFTMLANFSSVAEVKTFLSDLHIVNVAFNQYTQPVTLHWIVTDKDNNCIVIEGTKHGLVVSDNPIGVLTNAPTFDWHLTNLATYLQVSNKQPEAKQWVDLNVKPLGQGLGTIGLPSDFSPAARFVRTAFFKANMPVAKTKDEAISEFFHILHNVAMLTGSVMTPENHPDLTIYTSCMDLIERHYYYSTYANQSLTRISMDKEDLDAKELKVFSYDTKLTYNQGN